MVCKSNFLTVIILVVLCNISYTQDYKKLIPNRNYTQYALPDTSIIANSFNIVGDVQVAVPLLQGVYNANLGLWTVLPGSGVMSYCEIGEKDFYLKASKDLKNLELLYFENDSIPTEVGKIAFGNYRIKKVIGSESLIIYGSDGTNYPIFKYENGAINKIASSTSPVYDVVATDRQVLYVSGSKIHSIQDQKNAEIADMGILLTGICFGPNESFFISTANGVFYYKTFSDKKPQIVTKVLNGVVHYQSENLFLLDYLTNSVFRIEFKDWK